MPYRFLPMWTISVLLLCAGYGPASLAASPPDPIWTGTSGEFHIEWTTADIRISRQDKPAETLLSLRSMAAAEWNKMSAETAEQNLEMQVTYRLLSVVGPYLSYEEANYCDCGGAHPTEVKRFRTIDLGKIKPDGPMPVSLTDLFLEKDIFAALASDKLVQSALRQTRTPKPRALAELLDAIDYRTGRVGDCGYLFSRELLQSFAFYDIREGKIAVRISLPYEAEVCRGQMTQLGILLPIPEKLRGYLGAAQRKTGGLLMEDTAKLPKDAQSVVEFSNAKQ